MLNYSHWRRGKKKEAREGGAIDPFFFNFCLFKNCFLVGKILFEINGAGNLPLSENLNASLKF